MSRAPINGSTIAQVLTALGGATAWLRMDDTSGNLLDSSGNSHDGVVQSGTVFRRLPGIAGDGDAATRWQIGLSGPVDLNTSTAIDPDPFSVAVWMRTYPGPSGSWFPTVISKGATSATNGLSEWFLIYWGSSPGNMRFLIGSTTTATADTLTTTNGGLNDGRWHHVVAVADATTLRAYIDGIANAATTTRTLPVTHTANPVRIGGVGGGSLVWSGDLDEVMLFSFALTPAQVTSLYNATRATPARAAAAARSPL